MFATIISTKNRKLKDRVQDSTTKSFRKHPRPKTLCLGWALDLGEPTLWNSLFLFEHRKIMLNNRYTQHKTNPNNGLFLICGQVFLLFLFSWDSFLNNSEGIFKVKRLVLSWISPFLTINILSRRKSYQLSFKNTTLLLHHHFGPNHSVNLDYCNSVLSHPLPSPLSLSAMYSHYSSQRDALNKNYNHGFSD